MSREIDERVVSMEFDNKQFESNVKTSLSTIDKLKRSLNFNGAAKGFNDIDAASKKCNFNVMSKGIEAVQVKFSALQVMGITALQNITNSAIAAGKRIASALTTDPIKTGFQEYETQIGSVQTILANTQSKGSTIDDVNRALDELNEYADRTIYNFTEMTRNIGTFTAAGVDLDKSVQSIKGIANLAAISGSTSQQASTAMYQLSQALAAGKVQLMDWNSVVNAGMGGEVFQTALKRTAANLGHNVDAMIAKYGSFRESLTQGEWLTAEVLTETLAQLSGAYTEADLIAQGYTESQAKEIAKLADMAESAATDVKTFTQLWDVMKESVQSGWAQTWEIVIGDFEEAKAFWSEIAKELTGADSFLTKSADSRNQLLEGALTSNWDRLVDKINNAGVKTEAFEESLRNVLKNNGHDIDALIEKCGSLEEVFTTGAVSSDLLNEALSSIGGTTADLAKITRDLGFDAVGDDVKEAQRALRDLGYDLGKFGTDGVDGIIGEYTENAIKAFQKNVGLEATGIIDKKTLAALKEASAGVNGINEECSDLIDNITEIGGRKLLIDSLKNAYFGLKKALSSIGGAWRDIFEPMKPEQLYKIIASIHEFSKKLIMSDESADKLKRTFKGLFAIIDIVSTVVGGGLKAGFKILSKVLGAVDLDILDVTAHAGDAIVAFRDWLFENNIVAKGFDKLVSGIAKTYVAIRNWIKEFKELPVVQENLARFKQAFSNTLGDFKAYFGEGIERIKAFIELVKNLDSLSIDNIKKIIKDFVDNVLGYFFNIDGKFENLKSAFKKCWSDITVNLEKAGIKFDEFKNKISNFVSAVKQKLTDNAGGIAAVGIIAVLFLMVKKVTDILKVLTNPLEHLDGLFENFGDIFGSVGDVLEAFSKKIKSESLLNIAKAIAILAASVAVLALLPVGKVWSSVGAIAALGVGLVIMSKTMGSVKDWKDIGKLSALFISLSSALLLMAFAAKIIGGMELNELIQGGVTIGLFLGAMVGMMAATKLIGADATGFATAMIKLTVGLLIIAAIVKIFGSMDFGTLVQGTLAVAAFLGMMVGIMAATELIKTRSASFGKAMLMLSAGLILMSFAVKILGDMKPTTLLQGGLAVLGFMGIMVGLMAATKLLKKDMPAFGAVMTGIGIGLLGLAFSIKILGQMDMGTLLKGTIIATAFLGIIAILMLATRLLSSNSDAIKQMGKTMLAFSASMLLLTASIAILSLLDSSGIDKAMSAITKVGLLFAGLMVVSKFASDCKSTLIGISIAVGVLAISLAALSFIDAEKLKTSVASLSVVMGMLALVFLSTKNMTPNWGSLVAVAGMILLLSGSLVLLCSLPLDNALEMSGALSLLMVSLAAAMKLVGGMQTVSFAAIGGMALMGLIVAELALILWGMQELNIQPSMETAKALSLLLMAMSASLVIVSLVGALWAPALIGIGVLAAFIAAVGGIVVGLGALVDKFPQLETFLDKGMPILEKIGFALGSFLGHIVQGFGAAVMELIPLFGQKMSEFMTNIQPFLDGAKNIDTDAVSGVKILAEALLVLVGANILDSLSQLFTGGRSVTEFASELVPLATAFKSFAREISGLDDSMIAKAKLAAEAVKALAETAANIPTSGGWKEAILGVPDMIAFSDGLTELGPSFKEFAESVTGLTDEQIQKVSSISNVIDPLVDIANKVPATDGWAQAIAGTPDMTEFVTGLALLGPAVVLFSDSIGDITDDDIAKMTNIGSVIDKLTEIAAKIPESGGWAQAIEGVPNLTTFARGLINLGRGIKSFNESVTTVTSDDVVKMDNISSAIDSLVSMSGKIPASGGLTQAISGAPNLSTFAGQMATFGEKVSSFAQTVTDVTDDDINKMASIGDAAKTLVGVAASLKGYDDSSWFNTNLTEFAEELYNFGLNMSKFSTSVSEVNGEKLADIAKRARTFMNLARDVNDVDTSVLYDFSNDIQDLGTGMSGLYSELADIDISKISNAIGQMNELIKLGEGMSSLDLSGFGGFAENLGKIGKTGLDNFTKSFKDSGPNLIAAGKQVVTDLTNGITSGKAMVIKVCMNLVVTCVDTLKSQYSNFKNAGKSVVQGFADGISSNTFKAEAKAKAMAQAAYTAAKKALDVNSPSKIFRALGMSVPEGFAMGIDKLKSMVYGSAISMTDTATDGAKYALSRIADVISSDIDAQPTIRPVIDLSGVTTGAGLINRMFGLSPSIGVMTNLGEINTMMRGSQNGGNGDVIAAIEDLGRMINNMSRDTYQINGITYDDGTNVSEAIKTLIRAAKVERRI